MMPIDMATRIFQDVVFLILALTAAASLWVVWRWREAWLFALPPLLVALHGLLFYVCVWSGVLPAGFGRFWSAVLRAHTALTLLMGTLALWLILMDTPEPGDTDGEADD